MIIFDPIALGADIAVSCRWERDADMLSTEEWARSHNISTLPVAPAAEGYSELYKRSEQEIAVRALILRGISDVVNGKVAELMIESFRRQNIWSSVTPEEKAFL